MQSMADEPRFDHVAHLVLRHLGQRAAQRGRVATVERVLEFDLGAAVALELDVGVINDAVGDAVTRYRRLLDPIFDEHPRRHAARLRRNVAERRVFAAEGQPERTFFAPHAQERQAELHRFREGPGRRHAQPALRHSVVHGDIERSAERDVAAPDVAVLADDHPAAVTFDAFLDVRRHPAVEAARALGSLVFRNAADDALGDASDARIAGRGVEGRVGHRLHGALERDAPSRLHARQKLDDWRAERLDRSRGARVDPPAAHDHRAALFDHRRGHAVTRLDRQRAALRRQDHELAARVGDVLFAEVPAWADVARAPAFTRLILDALGLDVIADLEVRQGQGWLALHHLRLEKTSVFLDHPQVQVEPGLHLLLGHLGDRLRALHADDFVLEHAARAIGVNPDHGIIEHARRGARLLLSRALVVGDHVARAVAVGLELAHAFEQID